MPPQASQSSTALPPGYTLDPPPSGAAAPATSAALPPGYTLDSTPTQPSALDQLATVPGKVWRAVKSPLNSLIGTESPSVVGVGTQLYRKLSGQPNDLGAIPEKATLMFAGMDAPEVGEEAQPIAEAQAQNAPQRGASLASRRAPATASVESGLDHPAVSPWVDAIKHEAMKVPGANLATTAYKSLKGLFFGDGEAPAAPTPSVPAEWGKGTYGTPVDQWGKRVGPVYSGAPLPDNPGEFPGAPLPAKPPAEVLQAQPLATGAQPTPASPAAALGKIPAPWRMKPQADALTEVPTPATQPAAQTGEALSQVPIAPWRMKPQAAALGDTPTPATARQFTNKVGPMIDEGLGNPPSVKPAVTPGQPIYRRVPPTAPAAEPAPTAEGMPEGSIAVEGSKAVKSYHYDEPSQTMSVELNQGTMHRYAPVSPDQAQDFANAPSKGRAWLDLKDQPGTGHVAANYGNGWINKVSRAAGSNAATPAETPTASNGDLTDQLEDSVAAVNKAKWRTKKIQ
jgi:hypothetical protein